MLRKLWNFIVGKSEPVAQEVKGELLHLEGAFVTDVDELAKRISAEVLAGIRKEIAKAKQVAARPKVAVKKAAPKK